MDPLGIRLYQQFLLMNQAQHIQNLALNTQPPIFPSVFRQTSYPSQDLISNSVAHPTFYGPVQKHFTPSPTYSMLGELKSRVLTSPVSYSLTDNQSAINSLLNKQLLCRSNQQQTQQNSTAQVLDRKDTQKPDFKKEPQPLKRSSSESIKKSKTNNQEENPEESTLQIKKNLESKRIRRRAIDVPRQFKCPFKSCQKSYGHYTSLKFHFNCKHRSM